MGSPSEVFVGAPDFFFVGAPDFSVLGRRKTIRPPLTFKGQLLACSPDIPEANTK